MTSESGESAAVREAMLSAHAEGRHAGADTYFGDACPTCAATSPAGRHRPLRVLSLGAGVQSTAVLLMSLNGDLPPLDAAIFADTGWEPAAVYEHLAKLQAACLVGNVPLLIVSAGNLRTDHIEPTGQHLFIRNPRKHPEYLGKQRTFIPFYLTGEDGERGIGRRTCTKTYKIEPVEKEIRRLLGLNPGQRWPLHHAVTQVFGISYDEVQRMSDPKRPAIVHEYPLVDRKMTRDDCHAWMADHGWTAPRSACIGCPYHRNDEWRNLRDNAPDEFADAVAFDHDFRARQAAGLLPMVGVPFLHDQRVPLDEADIEEADDPQISLFDNECEGMCGV